MGGPATCDGRAVPATDNFQVRPYVLDGKEWASCEQYFQAVKFQSEKYQEQIRHETRPSGHGMRVWQMGQSRAHLIRPDWEDVKVQVMYEANAAKFAQHDDLRAQLLATRGRIIAAPSTDQWQRWNSQILECIREELRPSGEGDAAKIAELRRALGLSAKDGVTAAAPLAAPAL
mmetsp:Transcript_65623/g.182529  ORF Transcript_65623/g.182529 Transcript_65623/m.182529 type:complete len:174 (-) Transcript_65623:107-628(-)